MRDSEFEDEQAGQGELGGVDLGAIGRGGLTSSAMNPSAT